MNQTNLIQKDFPKKTSKKITPHSYLPFGLGPHICIGIRFALTEAKIIAAKILQKFTLRIVNENDAQPTVLFFVRPTKDFEMRLCPR